MQHVLILRCMYVYLCQSRLPWGVPSGVIRKRRTCVIWLHDLRACCMVTWFVAARVSRGYMVCARVAWLHGLCLRACCMVTWFARVVTWFAYSSIALALALPRVAESASFNAVAFLVYIYIILMFSVHVVIKFQGGYVRGYPGLPPSVCNSGYRNMVSNSLLNISLPSRAPTPTSPAHLAPPLHT